MKIEKAVRLPELQPFDTYHRVSPGISLRNWRTVLRGTGGMKGGALEDLGIKVVSEQL